jgi:hypothetical protein
VVDAHDVEHAPVELLPDEAGVGDRSNEDLPDALDLPAKEVVERLRKALMVSAIAERPDAAQ